MDADVINKAKQTAAAWNGLSAIFDSFMAQLSAEFVPNASKVFDVVAGLADKTLLAIRTAKDAIMEMIKIIGEGFSALLDLDFSKLGDIITGPEKIDGLTPSDHVPVIVDLD